MLIELKKWHGKRAEHTEIKTFSKISEIFVELIDLLMMVNWNDKNEYIFKLIGF